ncbi:ABC transporter permease [Candidatus Peregrinibacteria bacterium]|nr:ABC transporter permease [Candidatus Peregrinibacteria bacterium]
MKFSTVLHTALSGIMTNKLRSLLTISGIVIGITSVILMLSIGQSAQALIISQVASFGSDSLFVEPGNAEEGGPPIGSDFTILKYDAVMKLRSLPTIDRIAPLVWLDASVVSGNKDKRVRIVGTTPDNQDIDNAYPMSGRFFDETELRGRAKVAVLGHKMVDLLFDGEDPVGQRIKINRVNFKIIGVMEEQGTKFFQNLDEQIYIPVTTAQKEVFGVDYVQFASLRAVGDLDIAREDVRYALRDALNINNPDNDPAKDGFRIASQVDAVEIVGVVTNALTLLLSSIAAISLVVGGIGIMNIMLVSVTERTREIGLRKAIGAKKKDITIQFLSEAILLTMTGGVVGILLGLLLAFAFATVVKHFAYSFAFVLPVTAMVSGFLVALFVGLIFGIYPARRAAELDPIEALRYE